MWVPVTDATIDNGCLVVVPNNHRDGLFEHCPAVPGVSVKYLSPKFFDADRAVPLPMKRGSALFMTRTTGPPASLPNNSDQIRRYRPAVQPDRAADRPAGVSRFRGA